MVKNGLNYILEIYRGTLKYLSLHASPIVYTCKTLIAVSIFDCSDKTLSEKSFKLTSRSPSFYRKYLITTELCCLHTYESVPFQFEISAFQNLEKTGKTLLSMEGKNPMPVHLNRPIQSQKSNSSATEFLKI